MPRYDDGMGAAKIAACAAGLLALGWLAVGLKGALTAPQAPAPLSTDAPPQQPPLETAVDALGRVATDGRDKDRR